MWDTIIALIFAGLLTYAIIKSIHDTVIPDKNAKPVSNNNKPWDKPWEQPADPIYDPEFSHLPGNIYYNYYNDPYNK